MRKLILTALFLGTMAAGVSAAQSSPVPYADQDRCSGCDMQITRYPGPKGQTHLKDGTVEKYCSVRCMICNVALADRTDVLEILAQDAARIDWAKPDNNAPQINLHDAWLVVGSSKKATMGASIAPFAVKSEAEAFQKAFGGEVRRLSDLSRETLGCRKKKAK